MKTRPRPQSTRRLYRDTELQKLGRNLPPPKGHVFSRPEKFHPCSPDVRRDGPEEFQRCARSSTLPTGRHRCSRSHQCRQTPASRRDGPSVRLTEMRCATEPESHRPDKRPSRDAASTRRSSTTNRAPLLWSRRKRPARLQMLRILSRGYTTRNSSRADQPRALRRPRKLSITEFFSSHSFANLDPLSSSRRFQGCFH